jgi:hypothetical protein
MCIDRIPALPLSTTLRLAPEQLSEVPTIKGTCEQRPEGAVLYLGSDSHYWWLYPDLGAWRPAGSSQYYRDHRKVVA